jgi:hypothetical protein
MRSYPTEGDGMKRKLVAGAVAGLAVAGGGAAAVAATQESSPQEESKAVVEDAAKQLGVQPHELSNALKQALKNRIDAAVAAGRLTEEQGKELKGRVDADEFPLLGGPGLRGGHHGPGGPFGHGLDAAAEYLGTTEEALREQLRDGTTLAESAKKAGKSVDGLVDALVADAKEKLDAAQAAGRITAAEKQEKLQELREHVTALVNGERPEGGPRPFGRERRGPWS